MGVTRRLPKRRSTSGTFRPQASEGLSRSPSMSFSGLLRKQKKKQSWSLCLPDSLKRSPAIEAASAVQRWYYPKCGKAKLSTKIFLSFRCPLNWCEWFWLSSSVARLGSSVWRLSYVDGQLGREPDYQVPSLRKWKMFLNGGAFVVAFGYRKGILCEPFIRARQVGDRQPKGWKTFGAGLPRPSPGGTACRRRPETGNPYKN